MKGNRERGNAHLWKKAARERKEKEPIFPATISFNLGTEDGTPEQTVGKRAELNEHYGNRERKELTE